MEGNAAQHLQEDAWKSVAAFLVEKHAFRSVYDVNRDLASLQLVCKGSSQCADDAWKRVVELCAPSHVRVSSQPRSVDLLSKHLANHSAAPSRRALEAATRLPTDQLPVFLQRQADRYACIKAHAAMQSFGLAQQDLVGLQTVAIIRKKEKTYLKQAVIAVAKGKWGGVEALEKHQSNKLRLVLQRQEAERQRDEARAASKRPRTDYEAQFQDWQDSEDYRFDGYGNMHSKRRHTSYEDWHYDEWLKQETGYSEQAIENEVADGMCERENKEHDDDSDYDSEYDEDNDWDNRMDEATTHAQQKAVEQWCKSQMQNPWAMEEVPRRLQQHVPAEMKLAHQALLDGIAARMQR